MGARAHTNADSAQPPAPVKRYALGPSGRPPDDRTPPLALDHNHVAGDRPGHTTQLLTMRS